MHYWDFIKASSQRKDETGRGQELCARIGKLLSHTTSSSKPSDVWQSAKSAYGWVNKTPPKTVMENFNKKGPYSSQSFRGGCIHLRALLVGATSSLEHGHWVKASVALLAAQNDRKMEFIYGTIIFLSHTAKKFLHSTGWNQVGNTWRHAHVAEWMVPPQLSPNDRGAIAHKLREGWRAMHWDLFRYGPRREAALLRDQPFNPSRFEVARQVASKLLWGSFWNHVWGLPQPCASCPTTRCGT